MTVSQYKAYISYSHKDEAWASWLHRALESYRVPGKLVGTRTSAGKVPARIRPVFRDRDDLSSATDLANTVKQVLANSENLVVVCSPAAAASRWVGEEIRQFARLGRTDRIFCIIVDGEPAADGSVAACFPPALSEVGLQEPLAADVRKWADGKRVAKLKLVAGLLGLRLDDFLQRNLQRRRKRQVLTCLGAVAVLILAVITVAAQISERHEREKAEQLANFIVDLGERLKSDADLETLALISGEATRHLQNLDPDRLSSETGKRVALAFRQLGWVSQFQSKPDEALESFKRSRDLLSRLYDQYPGDAALLFELGNAEYYIGNLHVAQGRHDAALESMETYHRLTHALMEKDPDNPDWILELSYSHNNLAAIHLDSGKGVDKKTLSNVAEAIRLMEIVVSMKPDDQAIAINYATTLAWAADAQLQACKLEDALNLRHRVMELAEFSTTADPGDNEIRKQYAYALTGLARVQALTGDLAVAVENLGLAISILQSLAAADPSNLHYREEALYRRIALARLLGETGQLDLALGMLNGIKADFAVIDSLGEQGSVAQDEYIEFLLAYAEAELRQGQRERAKDHLQSVVDWQSRNTDAGDIDIFETKRLVMARYMWWQLESENDLGSLSMGLQVGPDASAELRSCVEADSAARMFIINGQREHAEREVKYLTDRGYADPSFIRFCRKHSLCS